MATITKPPKMRLQDFLAGIQAANTAEELEAAIHAPYKHAYFGRTWNKICQARIARGFEICAAHPHGRFVPRVGPRRKLEVCGETYQVGYGGNSTGERYAWYSAKEFAVDVLKRNGMTQTAAHAIWDQFSDYPHRCLETVQQWLDGGFPDPVMNTLIEHESYGGGHPIHMTVEQNDADEFDRRATMPCKCGGTLFDWGCGSSSGFDFVNWHCNACPKVFTEYVTRERMAQIRQPRLFAPRPTTAQAGTTHA